MYVSPIIIVVLFDVIPFPVFFVLILFSTLGLDVTFHYPLGLWLFSTTIALGIFRVFNQLVHAENYIVKLIPVFIYSVSLYLLVDIMAYFPHGSLMFKISMGDVLSIVVKSIISTLLYLGVYILAQYFRSDKSSKVKLK